jgi:sporulation protein YlmC with PRC-barrel domain
LNQKLSFFVSTRLICANSVFASPGSCSTGTTQKVAGEFWNGQYLGVFSPRQFLTREKYMLAKYLTAGIAASALLTSVAFAQTPTTTTTTNRADMSSSAASGTSFQGDWRASKMVGLKVYNDDNSSIGSINDLLTDRNGNIKAVVIGVGGVLGVGEQLVAVPFDKIKFVNEPVPSATASTTTTTPSAAGDRPTSSTTTGAATTSTNAAPAKANEKPWYPDHAVFNATKDELKAMPEFKYSN